MHSTGSIYIISSAVNFSLSFLGWMQSTGQASTQAVSFVPMQGSAITKAMGHLRLSEPTVRPTGGEVQAGGIASGFRSGCRPRSFQCPVIFFGELEHGCGRGNLVTQVVAVSVVFPTGQLRSAIVWRPRREPIRVRAPVRLSGTLLSKMGSGNASLGLQYMPTLRDIVYENVREGELYEKLDRNRVRCFACGHCCPIPRS